MTPVAPIGSPVKFRRLRFSMDLDVALSIFHPDNCNLPTVFINAIPRELWRYIDNKFAARVVITWQFRATSRLLFPSPRLSFHLTYVMLVHANKNASSLVPRLCIRASLSFKSYLIRRSGCVTARRNFRTVYEFGRRVLSFFLFFPLPHLPRWKCFAWNERYTDWLKFLYSFDLFTYLFSLRDKRYRNDEWLERSTRRELFLWNVKDVEKCRRYRNLSFLGFFNYERKQRICIKRWNFFWSSFGEGSMV